MKRILLFATTLIAGLLVGGWLGYTSAYFGIESGRDNWSKRDDAFLHRLEAIESTISCEELNKAGLSAPRKAGDIIYYINVQEEDYQVIGLSTDSIGPLVSWTGAGRPACK